jgi:hypothetical protein
MSVVKMQKQEQDALNVRETGWFTDEQLKQLAQDPANVVYKYTYENKPQLYTAEEMRDILKSVRTRYLNLRDRYPDKSDDELRSLICSEKNPWREFATLHNLNFACATSRDTDEEKMMHMYYMIYVKKLVECGNITMEQARSMIQQYFLRNSLKGKNL